MPRRESLSWFVIRVHIPHSRRPPQYAALENLYLSPNGRICGDGPEAHIRTEEAARMFAYLHERKIKARYGPRSGLSVELVGLSQTEETLQTKHRRMSRDSRHITEILYGERY